MAMLSAGRAFRYNSDDLGAFDMSYVGRVEDVSGHIMFEFDCPTPINSMRLYPSAFENHVDAGTISAINR